MNTIDIEALSICAQRLTESGRTPKAPESPCATLHPNAGH